MTPEVWRLDARAVGHEAGAGPLSPLRKTTFFHSRLCRWKAKLVGFSVDCRHCTAEFGSYFMRRPIGHQELPERFLFVVSPTIGIFRQE
jgi:hypothetical protein